MDIDESNAFFFALTLFSHYIPSHFGYVPRFIDLGNNNKKKAMHLIYIQHYFIGMPMVMCMMLYGDGDGGFRVSDGG